MAQSAILLSTDELQKLVLQMGHGFGVGDVLRFDGADFQLAQADTEVHAQVVGMVSAIADADHFWVSQIGYLSNLASGPYTPGDLYYLSPVTPGELTNTKPSADGEVLLPCFIADGADTGFFFASVGDLISSDDIGANTALSNLITTSINQSLLPDNDISHDIGSTLARWNNGYFASLRTGQLDGNTLTISARDVDGASYVPFITLTAHNTPTAVFNGDITSVTQAPGDNSTKLATTAYADAAAVGGGATRFLDNLLSPTAINQDLIADTDGARDLGAMNILWDNLFVDNINSGVGIGDQLILETFNTTSVTYEPYITLTAGNPTKGALNGAFTSVTQAPGTNNTTIATTAYTDAAATAVSGANKALSNLSAVAINTSLLPGTDNSIGLGDGTHRTKQIFSAGLTTGTTAGNTLIISGRDVDGASDTAFITITANNTPTASLNGDITTVTQTPSDSSTKIATTAYADAAAAGVSGANKALSNLASVAINTTLVSDTDVTDDLGTQTIRWNNIYAATLQTGSTPVDLLEIGAWDVDGAAFVPFVTLTAGNTPTCALASNVTGVTQAGSDNSTKLATTAYVDAAIPVVGANQALSNLVSVAINTTLVSDTDVTDSLGTQAIRWNNVYTATVQTGDTAGDTLQLGAWDVDGTAFVPYITFTANNTTTGVIASGMTATTQTPADNSTKIATTAYADAAATAVSGANKALSNLASVAINTSLLPATDNAIDTGDGTHRFRQMFSAGLTTGTTAADTLIISARDVDGASNTAFITLTANNTPTCVLASAVTATTQAASDNSTKLATTAYADAQVVAIAANRALSNLATVAINTSLLPGADNSISLGDGTHRTKQVFSAGLTTGTTAADTLIISARDVDGASDTAFITLTANNTPTCVIASAVTATTQSASTNNTTISTTAYTDAAAGVVNTELNRRVNLVQTNVAANSNTTFTLVSNTADYYKVTFTSSCTIAFTFPSTEVTSMCVQMINAGAFTVTWTSVLWPGGAAPTFTSSGTDVIVVWHNGDNIIYAALIGKAFA